MALRVLAGTGTCVTELVHGDDAPDSIIEILDDIDLCEEPREDCARDDCPLDRAVADAAAAWGEGPLFEAVARLGETLGLGDVERDVLAAAVLFGEHDVLGELSAIPGAPREHPALVAMMLARRPEEIREALAPESALVASGILVEPDDEDEEEALPF